MPLESQYFDCAWLLRASQFSSFFCLFGCYHYSRGGDKQCASRRTKKWSADRNWSGSNALLTKYQFSLVFNITSTKHNHTPNKSRPFEESIFDSEEQIELYYNGMEWYIQNQKSTNKERWLEHLYFVIEWRNDVHTHFEGKSNWKRKSNFQRGTRKGKPKWHNRMSLIFWMMPINWIELNGVDWGIKLALGWIRNWCIRFWFGIPTWTNAKRMNSTQLFVEIVESSKNWSAHKHAH